MSDDGKSPSADAADRPDPADRLKALQARWAALAARGQKVLEAASRRDGPDDGFQVPDPAAVMRAFGAWWGKALADPKPLFEAQQNFWQDYFALAQRMMKTKPGEKPEPVAAPAAGDRRFADPAWSEQPGFDFIRQAYLLYAKQVREAVAKVDGLDAHTRHQTAFYTDQVLNALAPTNFAATNPKVLKATLDSGGENLLNGLDNMLADLERGGGKLDIAMVDTGAFEFGRNIATTPGKVVYQNDLLQLIQYAPATATVKRRPLLIVPPWINKFYILDLAPKNSFIKWAVGQGLTVFVVSWVNPGTELAHKGFDDYLLEGPMACLDAIEQATGEKEINIVGYCIGGTLTAAALARMATKRDTRIKSATFLTTMVDFAEAGDLAVFVDEPQLKTLDEHMKSKGYLEGRHMAAAFNLMRSNDLIWSFFVNNYLMGRQPAPFDLLYWNADATRMPAKMHEFYLRAMYLENRLVQPGGVTLAGTPIDLSKVKLPVYILSTREDHIAPWKSTYAATQLYAGPVKFVLAGSGHIAGVVNPPTAKKYGHWTGKDLPAAPDDWLAAATQHEGSWWPDWRKWLEAHAGDDVPARTPGAGKLKAIEDAPGSYVRVRAAE